MNLQLLYQWIRVIQIQFDNLGKWQATGLAVYSFGVVLAESCRVTKVAESLGQLGRLPTVEKRLKRWLKNERIDVQISCQTWIRWLWVSSHLDEWVVLVDETKIGDRIGVMMVSLAYDHRAIALMWRCYVANSSADYPAEGQVNMIVAMLAAIQAVLPDDCVLSVQADRGIGC